MQRRQPLTPALSPSDGEREKLQRRSDKSLNSDAARRGAESFPLPIGWGEGQGEGLVRLNTCGFVLLLVLLAAGCVTPPPPPGNLPRAASSFPADALVTQRAVLTARGRQFTLNGCLALSGTGGKRLVIMENFSAVLADVLVKPDGTVHVMRSSRIFRPAWIERYVAADMLCIFGNAPDAACPVRMLSPTHFVIERRRYKLDLQIVETKPGPQPAELFDETQKATP